MTARAQHPVTDDQLARAGRVWESGTVRKRCALIVLGLGYLPAFNLSDQPWGEIGRGTQTDIARGLAELWELMGKEHGDRKTAGRAGAEDKADRRKDAAE